MNKDKLIEDLIRDEGMKTDLYEDTVGKLTIGVGRNLTDRGVDEAEAMFMLMNDIAIVEKELDHRIPWWRDLPDDAQRALANLMFNMGWPTLSKFVLALAALQVRNYKDAADEFLESRWATQVGRRAIRVTDLIRNA